MAKTRRWWTFSFRTMLFVFVAVGIGVSLFVADYKRAERIYNRETETLAALEKLQGTYERKWRGPVWWRCMPMHEKFTVFQRVVSVDVGGSAWSQSGHYTDEQLSVLLKFDHLEQARIVSFALTDKGLLRFAELQKLENLKVQSFVIPPSITEQLQAKLPHCKLVVSSSYVAP